jgi:hypothetical protein
MSYTLRETFISQDIDIIIVVLRQKGDYDQTGNYDWHRQPKC